MPHSKDTFIIPADINWLDYFHLLPLNGLPPITNTLDYVYVLEGRLFVVNAVPYIDTVVVTSVYVIMHTVDRKQT